MNGPAPRRVAALRERLLAEDIPALLVTHLPNVRYLSGFTGSNARLLVLADEILFVTDGRYAEQAPAELSRAGLDARVEAVSAGVPELLARATRGCSTVGVEAATLAWSEVQRLEDALSADLVPTDGLVEDLRAVKDDDEIEAVEAAARLADDALAEVLAQASPELTEAELALALEWSMRTRGAEGTSFDLIVAAGPNGALPHYRPGSGVVGRNRCVVLDYGCRLDGYCSDATRTVSWGDPHPDIASVWEVVAAAQDAARSSVAAGVPCRDVDAAARQVIADAGFADAFVHGTGHGVGLEIHERPRLAATSNDVLAPGMVVTVEPGIYLSGLGGVRIEDLLVVTEEGCRDLTTAPRVLVL